MKRYTDVTTTNRDNDLYIRFKMYIFDGNNTRTLKKDIKITYEQKQAVMQKLGKPTRSCGLWGGGVFLIWDRVGYEKES